MTVTKSVSRRLRPGKERLKEKEGKISPPLRERERKSREGLWRGGNGHWSVDERELHKRREGKQERQLSVENRAEVKGEVDLCRIIFLLQLLITPKTHPPLPTPNPALAPGLMHTHTHPHHAFLHMYLIKRRKVFLKLFP